VDQDLFAGEAGAVDEDVDFDWCIWAARNNKTACMFRN